MFNSAEGALLQYCIYLERCSGKYEYCVRKDGDVNLSGLYLRKYISPLWFRVLVVVFRQAYWLVCHLTGHLMIHFGLVMMNNTVQHLRY